MGAAATAPVSSCPVALEVDDAGRHLQDVANPAAGLLAAVETALSLPSFLMRRTHWLSLGALPRPPSARIARSWSQRMQVEALTHGGALGAPLASLG